MKTISPNQRVINIINKALALGFTFDEQQTMEEIRFNAEDFLIENAEPLEYECEVRTGRDQQVSWSDGMGFEFQQWGEIVDFSAHWHDAPETKVFHNTVLDSEGNVCKLYYLVGETDFNAPDGYYYSNDEKKHVPIELEK